MAAKSLFAEILNEENYSKMYYRDGSSINVNIKIENALELQTHVHALVFRQIIRKGNSTCICN